MEVGRWLRSLGLEQYAPAFRDNAIDSETLITLTADDLRELGVAAIGHRKKLLAAIAALGSAAPALPLYAETIDVSSQPRPVSAAPSGGERRHLTVMFCDLVGSTEIAGRLDAEEWRDIVADYHRAVAESVARFGGHVAKNLGDGALIYFGYPQALENDAERALRAGLAIIEAVTNQSRALAARGSPEIAVRVGIHAGPVVISEDAEVFGEVPNVAARVQAAAEPGTLLISRDVHRLVSGLFVASDRGAQTLKGVAEPVGLFQVLRASGAGRRRAAGRVVTPLVGRDEELRQFESRWGRARAGQGQLVLLVGEPGLGKSRLTEEFQGRLSETPHTWVEWSCSQLLQNAPFHPFIEFARRRLEEQEPTPEGRVAALAAWHRAVGLDPAQSVPLVAPLLELPVPTDYPPPPSAPEERRRRQIATLAGWVTGGARTQAILLLVEDLHWADPSTIDLLRVLAEQGAAAPLMMLVTSRPEFRAPWPHRSHHTVITLGPLERSEVLHMVGEVAARRAISGDMIEALVARTGGVPLFIEEMTRLLLEGDGRGGAQHIPLTLQASLTARLDRLGPAKGVAQIAAVLGREFTYPLIRAVVGSGEAVLAEALERLAEADLIHAQGMPPDSTYRFKHALVQDAAYETLLKSRRRELHGRIAEVLEDQFPAIFQSQPELLAHHCSEAGLADKAAAMWARAGLRSLDRSAAVEAAAQLSRALDYLKALPGTMALRQEQIKLQVGLATALMHTKGFAASETKVALDQARLLIGRAEALGEGLEDQLLPFSILYGSWVTNFVAFNSDAVLEIAGQFLSMAEKQGAPAPVMIGHRLMGTSLLMTGNLWEGRTHLDKAIALYDPIEHRTLTTRFSQDMGVVALSFRSWASWALGYAEAAHADTNRAINAARESGHALTLIYALSCAVFTHLYCGSYAAAEKLAEEAAALAEDKGALFWKALILLDHGCLLTLMGKFSEAVEMITSGISLYQSTQSVVHTPRALSYLAWAYAELRQFEQAWQVIDEALAAVEARNYRWWESEIYRTAGEISRMARESDEAKAESYFERALEVARGLRAKSWELRAATSMARLWRDQGKRQQAHNLLAPVYSWFTEGFDTLDLKEAKALLLELAP